MPYGSKLHIHLPTINIISQLPNKSHWKKKEKSPSLLKVYKAFRENNNKKSRAWTISRKTARQSKRTRQKNERRDEKGESNDSPEISDRAETSDIPKEKLP